MVLQIGDTAPGFNLPDQNGQWHNLKSYLGSWTIVYFYPRDNTPGCTREACSIRDNWGDFSAAGIQVVGISTDSIKSHQKFSFKHKLPFTLLADEEKKAAHAYGVYGKKKFLGKEFTGTKRISFLLDPKGKIAKIYEKVKPSEHAEQILNDFKSISS